MRALDAPAPPVPPHTIPPDQPSAEWPAQPIIGLEWVPQGTWDSPDPASVWDNPELVWDDPDSAVGFTDVWCDTTGVEIVHGEPDEQDLFAPSQCTLTLYDPTGRYRRRTIDGQLIYYAPGRRLSILADIAGTAWWLFNGRIAEWLEQPGDMIQIVAYAAPATLAQPPGRDWSPGATGDTLRPRLTAILAASGAVGVTLRSDLGTATYSLPDPDQSAPWEMMQRAAWSDGGVIWSDADDTLIGRDRTWRLGRGDEPVPPLTLTDNVCVAGNTVVWDTEIGNVDSFLAGRVVLSNDADPALVAVAANPAEFIDPALVFTHPDTDLWRTQSEGDAVAAAAATDRGAARMSIALARVFLHDPRRRTDADWQKMIDVRVGDRVGWQHEYDNPDGTVTLLDVDVIAVTVRHIVTPETWLVELESAPATGYRTVQTWDDTTLTWDDTAPEAIWR